jgi:hypothetical protein
MTTSASRRTPCSTPLVSKTTKCYVILLDASELGARKVRDDLNIFVNCDCINEFQIVPIGLEDRVTIQEMVYRIMAQGGRLH